MWPFRAQSIAEDVRRRNITRLLHSTHLYANLPRIFETGALQTAGDLTRILGRERAARFVHDHNRYEKFSVGLNYLNCAISNPNYELLYHRSKSAWSAEWVHFSLDKALLTADTTKYCAVSAATDRGAHLGNGLEAFRALFAKTVGEWTRAGIESWEPTHPQAEVLVEGSLAWERVQEIIVPNPAVATEVERLAAHYERTISILVLPHYFVWPARLAQRG